jgi:predicted ATPase
LVEELVAKARQAGFSILAGACFEMDRSYPYAPVVEMLHRLPGEFSEALSTAAGELTRILSGPPAPWPEPGISQSIEPEREKRRLFHALASLLAQLSTQERICLVIEDLHWCDETSLEFFTNLARQVSRLPILL